MYYTAIISISNKFKTKVFTITDQTVQSIVDTMWYFKKINPGRVIKCEGITYGKEPKFRCTIGRW